MVNILVVEDDKELNSLLCNYLEAEDYSVYACFDGENALETFERAKVELVISDIMMPKLDGFGLAEKIREINDKVPIIFMSAKDDKPSKQRGYKIGVDDYITKPFDIDELIFKVKAILRRVNIEGDKKLTVGNLTLDKEEHMAYVDGEELMLTVREFDMLFKFLSFPKKTFTRSKLMEEFWDYDSSATSRTVDVYMSKLREKTAKCTGFEIITVHGLGYKVILKDEQ